MNSQEENELQRALRLSEESFKIEKKLRKEFEFQQQREKEINLLVEMKKQKEDKNKSNEVIKCETLINLMKWQNLFIHRGVGSGLRNLGNSCFMNATLQCLAYTPPFAQLLIESNHSKQCTTSVFCALCEMEEIIPSMLVSKKIISPRNLFKNLAKINDLLTPGCQEDAHEFIQSLLDKIEWAYDDAMKPLKKKDEQNPIRKLFTGATKTCITCARCKSKSVTEEAFCCISLEVDDNVGLGEALEIFTQDELLRGDDKYFCNKCNRKCIAHKQLTLSSLPPILVLHFKRFCIQFASSHHKQGTAKKLPDHVEFPECLDFKKLENIIFKDDRIRVFEDSEYELYAVLVHSGPQLGYGHYYSLIKSSDDKWYRMNDMNVNSVNVQKVLKEQGYIVFYRRKTQQKMKKELNQIKLNNNNKSKDKNKNKNNINEPKVDVNLLTNDYFSNKCSVDQDAVFINNNNNNNNNVNVNGNEKDRTQYVRVPPMAIRPELLSHQQKLNGNNGYQEIYWPVTENENE